MNIPGERFTIPLEEGNQTSSFSPEPSLGLIKDVVENSTEDIIPTTPVLPPNASLTTGFPARKKRLRAREDLERMKIAVGVGPNRERTEQESISEENERRIASMSPGEIEQRREELIKNLSPGLIEKLTKRAELGDEKVHGSFKGPKATDSATPVPSPQPAPPESSVPRGPPKRSKKVIFEENLPPHPTIGDEELPQPIDIHFPRPPTTIDTDELDPGSPEFLTKLHSKYFPTLPADPSKLAWMAPVSPDEDTSSYHPSQDAVSPSALRFDFKGNLLPPRVSRELPAHLGLHHHAEAPNAAGYTVPELARLARSTFPTQRCMAMQTLGRVLFRLGKEPEEGGYGVEEIVQGLWRCMAEGRVIEGLEEAAAAKGGHVSVKAYATDALWLWQKGGGHRWKAE